MAEMPATALPAAALGPAGLQTVAELSAAHSGRALQMRAGTLCAQRTLATLARQKATAAAGRELVLAAISADDAISGSGFRV